MNRLFVFIILAMLAGIGAGYYVHEYVDAGVAKEIVKWLGVVTTLFLTLIKMIIAPLVLFTLIGGIAHMEDAAAVGRVGLKTIFWFIVASITSLTIGLIMVQWLQPGVGLALPAPDGAAAVTVDTSKFTVEEFIKHIIPKSIFDALAQNEIIQIVVFSLFVGTAIASLDDRAPQVLNLVEQGTRIMLKVTGYVMQLAPIAIFAALAATVAKFGVEVLYTYARFVRSEEHTSELQSH